MAENWKSTKEMAEYFSISIEHLRKRWGGPNGFLKEGDHWRGGPHPNSKKWWNVEACTEEAKSRGYLFPSVLEQG